MRLRQLRALLRWLQAEGLADPTLRIRLPAVPQQVREALTEEQVGRLWQSRYLTGPSAQAVRNRALFALMLTSGLRVAEVAWIEDRDFSWDDGIVVVTGKGNKERYVPVSRDTEALIRTWIGARDAEPVEVRGGGRGKTFELARTGIQELCRKIGRDVGFVLSPHRLRHTMALSYVRAGMDPFHLKRILGHKHIETTLVYVNLNTDDIRNKHAQFTPAHLVPHPPALAGARGAELHPGPQVARDRAGLLPRRLQRRRGAGGDRADHRRHLPPGAAAVRADRAGIGHQPAADDHEGGRRDRPRGPGHRAADLTGAGATERSRITAIYWPK